MMNRKQWKRAYRKLRVRRHTVNGESLFAQGMAILRGINAELEDLLRVRAVASWQMDRLTTGFIGKLPYYINETNA